MSITPIRVGLMGLSATSPLAWANTTHLTYLLSPEGRKYYTIAALCNSSPAAAAAAISAFHLPSTTKAYGSPEALANDPDIDLVVVSVNVAKHYALVKPALLAGKAAFVEWPLGANLAEAEELAGIARERGVRTIVGLQGRLEPLVDTIRGIVDSGNIGEVLSSSVVAAASQVSSQEVPALRYFLDSKTGGTITSIHFAHLISVVQGALGKFASFQSLTGNQRGTVDIVDPVTREILEPAVAKDTADHITLHGILESGALSAVFVRAGPQFDPAAPAMRWNIYGSKGEIEITSPTIFINMSIVTQVRVRIGDGPIEAVKVEDGGDQGKAANVRRVYESFYKGGEGARHATFEDALEDHRFLEEIYGGRLGEKVVYSSKNV